MITFISENDRHEFTEEQEKAVALAIHLDIEWFAVGETVYSGNEEEKRKEYNKETPKKERSEERWGEWAAENLTELQNEFDIQNDTSFDYGRQSYLVLTDEEADDLWDEYLENYLDECVEGADSRYFNRELWKKGARNDGRGHSLAGYDRNEDCQTVNGTDYYIYRTN